MSSHLSAMDFDVMIGDLNVKIETMTATITDNTKVAMTRGIPSGDVKGDVSCAGDIEVDAENAALIIDAARTAGSFRGLSTFDILCVGSVSDRKLKIELFGCRLRVSDLLNLDQAGGEKFKQKLTFDVTSKDFVRLDGVPYLSDADVRDL